METVCGIILSVIYTTGALFCWLTWIGMISDIASRDENMREKTKEWFVVVFGFLPPPIVYGFIIRTLITEVFK